MIHLIGSYYMTAGKNAYTVGEVEESRTKRVFKPGARYYSTLARAVAALQQRPDRSNCPRAEHPNKRDRRLLL